MTANAAIRIRAAVKDARSRSTTVPVVVALDGYSGAGKSTIALTLAQDADVCVVRVDDFYRVMDEGERAKLTAPEGVDLYFDWQRLRAEALVPLRNGRTARFQAYAWSGTGGLAPTEVEIGPAAVVVVDGVYSSRPELSDLVAISVLVDTALDVRRARITARGEAPDSWDIRWKASEDLYFSAVRPPSTFDLVVAG